MWRFKKKRRETKKISLSFERSGKQVTMNEINPINVRKNTKMSSKTERTKHCTDNTQDV